MTGLHDSRCTEMYILIFAFRGCYCLGSLTLQDFFQVSKYLLSRKKIRNYPSERFSLLACIVTPGPLSLELSMQEVGRFLSRISYYLSSYVFKLYTSSLRNKLDQIAARNKRVFLEKCIPFSRQFSYDISGEKRTRTNSI